MDFGAILDKWEKQAPAKSVIAKDFEDPAGRNAAGERRRRLLRKKPDAFIDLHGLTGDEAWKTLETFFEDSRRNGLEKLLVIHGKGNHLNGGASAGQRAASGGSVLKETSRRFIEACTFAGESGYSSARDGGSGATWVILKGIKVPEADKLALTSAPGK